MLKGFYILPLKPWFHFCWPQRRLQAGTSPQTTGFVPKLKLALGPWFLFPFPKLCHKAAVIPPSGPLLEAKINSALFSEFFSFFLFGTQF